MPDVTETEDLQLRRVLTQLGHKNADLDRYIYLVNLLDHDETLKRNCRRPARLPKNSRGAEESTRRIASIYPSRTVLGTPNRDG